MTHPPTPLLHPFIVFEGLDSSGKTTQSKLFTEKLELEGAHPLWTFEPGATPLGKEIRALLLHSPVEVSPRAEALLFAANRADHVETKILPHLKVGPVVCDRYIDSSGAYQGFGRDLGWKEVYSLSEWATNNLYPDLTFVIDVPVEVTLERLGRSPKGALDKMEKTDLKFKQRSRSFFLERAAAHPSSYRVVKGHDRSVEEIAEEVWSLYEDWRKL